MPPHGVEHVCGAVRVLQGRLVGLPVEDDVYIILVILCHPHVFAACSISAGDAHHVATLLLQQHSALYKSMKYAIQDAAFGFCIEVRKL